MRKLTPNVSVPHHEASAIKRRRFGKAGATTRIIAHRMRRQFHAADCALWIADKVDGLPAGRAKSLWIADNLATSRTARRQREIEQGSQDRTSGGTRSAEQCHIPLVPCRRARHKPGP